MSSAKCLPRAGVMGDAMVNPSKLRKHDARMAPTDIWRWRCRRSSIPSWLSSLSVETADAGPTDDSALSEEENALEETDFEC